MSSRTGTGKMKASFNLNCTAMYRNETSIKPIKVGQLSMATSQLDKQGKARSGRASVWSQIETFNDCRLCSNCANALCWQLRQFLTGYARQGKATSQGNFKVACRRVCDSTAPPCSFSLSGQFDRPFSRRIWLVIVATNITLLICLILQNC